MTSGGIRFSGTEQAIDEIAQSVRLSRPGDAPFALVVGSGFSHGLVPLVKELVTEDIPLQVRLASGHEPLSLLKERLSREEKRRCAADFWRDFANQNRQRGLDLKLDQDGFPVDTAQAYQAAFDPANDGALRTAALSRQFQREVMQLERPRLNAAHFLLASILGAQPATTGQESPRFNCRGAFCRLILTTNFDPFLQIALQMMGKLYLMSDQPELGMSQYAIDDQIAAVHLVYVHGNVHRRSQAADKDAIHALMERNAQYLATVLCRMGVIVLGYSGWDDAIARALTLCATHEHGLYWCGREADPLTPKAFGQIVPEILRKPNSRYIQISGAGSFMAALHTKLVKGNPRLLANPFGQLRETLEALDLSELDKLAVAEPKLSSDGVAPMPAGVEASFFKAKEQALVALRGAETAYESGLPVVAPVRSEREVKLDSTQSLDVRVTSTAFNKAIQSYAEKALTDGQLAAQLGNYAQAEETYSEALRLSGLSAQVHANLLQEHGFVLYHLGRLDDAISKWTQVIEGLPGAPVDEVANALVHRGVVWGKKGETDKEMADYTKVIEGLSGAPVIWVASALGARGVSWGKKGEADKQMADYTKVIEGLPGAPVDMVAMALVSRGATWGKKGETDKQMADYTKVIEGLPGAPVDAVANALVNRGVSWGKKGETDKEIADYTKVIEGLPGAPVGQVADALGNRGWVSYKSGYFLSFLNDTQESVQKRGDKSSSAFNLGLALLANSRDEEAIGVYRQAAEKFPAEIEKHGLVDLREAQETWLSQERARPVITLLESRRSPALPPPVARTD